MQLVFFNGRKKSRKFKHKKTVGVVLAGLAALSLLTACHTSSTQTSSQEEDEKLSIVTSFYPVYEFTKNIVGNEADVKLLVPAGTEPHDYEPSAKDMKMISNSDVFVYHNENMETWVDKSQKLWKKDEPKIIEGTKGLLLLPGSEEEDHDHGGEDHHHDYDPHTWLSPKMAIKEVEVIEKQLKALYPQKAKTFSNNATKYINSLKKLDEKFSSELKNAKQKSFVTQHAAFRYLALDYGLNQIPISGLNPDQEPSAARLAELKKYVEQNDIHYIYFENNANNKFAKTLATEAKVQMAVLNPLESLTSKQIDEGENYISVMEENLKSLKKSTSIKGKDIQSEAPSETTQNIANGYFSDDAVKDRSLSDYTGEWQSVYPLLQKGSLDQVFDYKSKIQKDKTASEYKKYYENGYKSDVSNISINSDTITFTKNDVEYTYKYKYAGYKILNYEKGNRGVRYLFETEDKDAGEFKYVQFSDHNISPEKTAHFHIFHGGESQEKVLEELENWPTYYPESLSPQEVAQEMLAH
ncbi:zinc ABC transporter substrate-binding protein AdcA [Lactococcus garvieae]|uniref:zinc ABC transporter substrate-binding protein AdcA n=1 Tax=Lactococcus garvieae TaxID=1363 RepID=UPI0018D5B94F|nr:zinc ABC transporter substrate-binding protein AdcA [Lactococcus garvieae]QPS71552.1 zinc ABC transporter substrate-binding protein AdcA [Lactococcus garvieae]